MLYFCAKVKEIFSKIICSLDFFGSFFIKKKMNITTMTITNNIEPKQNTRSVYSFYACSGFPVGMHEVNPSFSLKLKQSLIKP